MAVFSLVQNAELLTLSELLKLLGRRSRQSVYDLMRRDATFPRPVKLGSEFSIAWRQSEVKKWIEALPRAEFDGLSVVERRKRVAEMSTKKQAVK